MSIKRVKRTIRRKGMGHRVALGVPDPNPIQPRKGKFKLKKSMQSRLGKHKAGERGTFLSDANGTGRFFPDRGGLIILKASDIRLANPPERKGAAPVLPVFANSGLCGNRAKRKIARTCKPSRASKIARTCKKKDAKKIRRIRRKTS